jgi:hypothetical protein
MSRGREIILGVSANSRQAFVLVPMRAVGSKLTVAAQQEPLN